MEIKNLIKIVRKKILHKLEVDELIIIDKTSMHIRHASHKLGKYHLKVTIKSNMLKHLSKLESSKLIYKIIKLELRDHIHSIQLKIN